MLNGSLTVGTPPVADGSLGSQPLIVTSTGGEVGLSWEPIESGGLPITYNVYRGGLATLFTGKVYDHSCFMSGLTQTSVSFGDASGDRYYLISAVAPGFGEGILGADSAGAAIPNPGGCP